jgi:putative transport protein
LIGHIAVAGAICYIFGTLGGLVLQQPRAKASRHRLAGRIKNVEASLGIQRKKLGVSSAWQPIGFRAYVIFPDAPVVGKTIAEAEKSVPGARLFVERIRRKGEILAPAPTTVVEAGDTLAVVGRTDVLIKVLGPLSAEVSDSELLEIPVASFDVYVTSKAIAGKSLKEV